MALIAYCKDKDGKTYSIRVGSDNEDSVREVIAFLNPDAVITSIEPEQPGETITPTFAESKEWADAQKVGENKDVQDKIKAQIAAALPAGAKIEYGG